MDAIIFIVRTLLQVLLVTVFILRVLLPLVRADSRNQLSQAVIRLTNPLVIPLRRVLPPIGKIDTASVVAVFIVQAASAAVLWLLGAFPGVHQASSFIAVVFLYVISTTLQIYIFSMFLYVVLSWVAPGTYSPAGALFTSICEPLLRPVRRIIPPIAQIDLSAFFVMVLLIALNMVVNNWLRPYQYFF
jgi:YggT family protein